MTDPGTALIDVLICTYRRPDLLAKTLTAIQGCATPVGKVRIVVVDNDDRQSARSLTERWAAGATVEVTYLSQPVQNISLTRNMALSHARAPWIALIDDDEVPDENWLCALLGAAEQFEADVVFAPVISQFDAGAPKWATEGPIFQRKRFPTGTVVPLRETRTGNVLLRGARLAADAMRFDPELGLSGGEDSEFFARLAAKQYRMVWCDEACVREWTPPSRTTLSWIVKRAFRIGSVEAYNKRRFARYREAAIAAAKSSVFLAQGSLLALFWAPLSPSRSVQGVRRAAMGAGFFYGLLAGPFAEYSAPAAPPESGA
jgi:succinoglycan biosynthesis protein ExoM